VFNYTIESSEGGASEWLEGQDQPLGKKRAPKRALLNEALREKEGGFKKRRLFAAKGPIGGKDKRAGNTLQCFLKYRKEGRGGGKKHN